MAVDGAHTNDRTAAGVAPATDHLQEGARPATAERVVALEKKAVGVDRQTRHQANTIPSAISSPTAQSMIIHLDLPISSLT